MTLEKATMQSGVSAAPRRRMQFSLLSLLCVVVALGAVMGYWFSQRETNRLRAEVRKLREEVGVLNVDDPAKFYARSIRLNENLKWRWRVYFPASRKYRIHVQTGGIGVQNFPLESGGSTTFTAGPGELTFDAEVRKTEVGAAEVYLLTPAGKMTMGAQTVRAGYTDWVSGPRSTAELNPESKAYDPEKPLEFVRVRAMVQTAPGSSTTTSAPSQGLLIWIEPEK